MAPPALWRILIAGGLLLFAAPIHSQPALAQSANQAPGQKATAFCIDNAVDGETLTAQIGGPGQTSTKVDLPTGERGCCVKFCRQNPSPSGYKVSILVRSRQVCTLTVANGQLLRVEGTAGKASCTATALN